MALDLEHPGRLSGRRVLVTGGSSGFGRALSLALLEAGAKVVTCARDERGLAPLAQAGALTVPADVSKPGDVSALMVLARHSLGGLDAVINNAAILPRVRLSDQSLADWRRTLEINLSAPWLVTREALPLMRGGSIVMVTSGLGWFPMEPYNSYAVSKAGVNLLTRAFAQELGGRFRVNAFDPGTARTRMNPEAGEPPERAVPALLALAALGPDGPTGLCFKRDGRVMPWDREPALRHAGR